MTLKWLMIVVTALALLIGAYLLYMTIIVNPRTVTEIQTNPQGERARIVMLMTFPDGRQIPMNYLREGNKVFAGADGRWWRAFVNGGSPVSMLIRGETVSGHAVVILDDPVHTHEIFARLRPTVPKWLPDWLNGKLVEVTLDAVDVGQ